MCLLGGNLGTTACRVGEAEPRCSGQRELPSSMRNSETGWHFRYSRLQQGSWAFAPSLAACGHSCRKSSSLLRAIPVGGHKEWSVLVLKEGGQSSIPQDTLTPYRPTNNERPTLFKLFIFSIIHLIQIIEQSNPFFPQAQVTLISDVFSFLLLHLQDG